MKDILDRILSYFPSYIGDIALLAIGPKRFMEQQRSIEDRSLEKPLTFLGISLALCFVLQASLPPRREFWADAGPHGLLYLIGTIALAAVVRLSWRVVGGRATFQQVLRITCYYCSVVLLGVVITNLCYLGILRLFEPRLYELLFATAERVDWRTFVAADPLSSVSFVVAMLIQSVGYAALFIWVIVGWGAYRELNGLSKRKSCTAFFLAAALSLPLLAVLSIAHLAVY